MEELRVIIAGGRDLTDYELVKKTCDFLLKEQKNVQIVSGKAKGADTLGEVYAKEKGFSIAEFPAEWDKYGKSAGYRRNSEMATYANVLIAFWDGKSRGTEHMIDLAKGNFLTVRVQKY